MFKSKKLYAMGIAPLFFSGTALGQINEEDALRVSALLDLRSVDNAARRADAEEDVTELQTRANLLAVGQLSGRLYDFETDYSLQTRRYSEFSDRNEQQLLGSSDLLFGTSNRRHYLQLSHSSRDFLLDPEGVDVPQNRDNRTIISAGGYTSTYLGRPNTLSFEASVSDIRFSENVDNEALRVSAGSTLSRRIKPNHTLGIQLMGYQLDYTNTDEELTYRQVALLWEGALQRSEFTLELGYNAMEREEETTTSPLVRLDWAYQTAAQRFVLSAGHWLSDTSQGGGLDVVAAPTAGVDGRVQVVDQFERTDLALRWSHASPCPSCTVAAALSVQTEDYIQFPEFSSREVNVELQGGYQLNPSLILRLRSVVGSFTEPEDETSNDYIQTVIDAGAAFPDLVRDGMLEVFVGVESRDFDRGNGFTSGFIGASFEYVLFDR